MQRTLSVVISVLNQTDMAKTCYSEIIKNSINPLTEFIVIDNGSDSPLKQEDFPKARIFRNEHNIGVYPTFKQGMEISLGGIVAFLHSDVVIWEKGWDERVISAFNQNQRLGLLGFIGSTEIDDLGGRGGGTASNFQGKILCSLDSTAEKGKSWIGSSWDKHGGHTIGYMNSSVVDGCVMVIERKAWNRIGYRDDFPPHHFYDRLISTQMLEAGFTVATLGIEFDHISGQTVNQEKKYQHMAYEWLIWNTKDIIDDSFDPDHNYDVDMYKYAEEKWLREYKYNKHLIPIKV